MTEIHVQNGAQNGDNFAFVGNVMAIDDWRDSKGQENSWVANLFLVVGQPII